MVTREELHQRLWPNGTIVEFKHSIYAAIKQLRLAYIADQREAQQRPHFVVLALTSYFQFRRFALLPFALCTGACSSVPVGVLDSNRVLLSRKRPLSTV